jgi:hypothetical protein
VERRESMEIFNSKLYNAYMLKITETTTPEEILTQLAGVKNEEEITLVCSGCDNTLHRTRKKLTDRMAKVRNTSSPRKNLLQFCSLSCSSEYKNKVRGYGTTEVACAWCGSVIKKELSDLKSKNLFCNQSCSGSYNNTHRKFGVRRSKLEEWLEVSLTKMYPLMEIDFNRKDAINSELDIYFPSLKLAVELNGIFHYEPIYGEDKLMSIQNNDNRKFQACLENEIELCIIDVSQMKYFKEEKAQWVLNIISKIVDDKVGLLSAGRESNSLKAVLQTAP